jgi:hypothetical protein
MDPVLNQGTTFCSSFYSSADLQPLDDMGWTPIAINAILDCDGDGTLNIIEIAGGSADTNTNNIPDECENFRADVNIGPGFTGLTLSEWSAQDLETLDGFNPNNFTLVFRGATDDTTLTHGSSDDIVARFSGFFNAPATGEYAFRVKHDEAATLRVAGQTLLALDERRGLDGFTTSQIAPQNFVLLDAGFRAFELTTIFDSSSDDVTVIADSVALGGWRTLVQGDFVAQLSDFPDCNNNGVDDQFDPDNDGDGLPDDCEADCDNDGIADETQFDRPRRRHRPGRLSQPGESVTINTNGSNFDTEIALFNADTGEPHQADDDAGPVTPEPDRPEPERRDLPRRRQRVQLRLRHRDRASSSSANCSAIRRSASPRASPAPRARSMTPCPIASGRSRWYEFRVTDPDCDGDGIPDDQEQDCDNNGVPDECEDLGSVTGAIDLGVVGEAGDININTVGSAFDTELGLWDSSGTLLANNDDINFPANAQSEIVRMFEPGDYLMGVGGFNTGFTDFGPDFETGGVEVNINGCAAGGSISIELGTVIEADILDLPPGRVAFFQFTIAEGPAPCNPADLAEPFEVLDLADIGVFVGGFTGTDPVADLNNDTIFDLADIGIFVTPFTGGCP